MRRFSVIVSFLALAVAVLPNLGAQDQKVPVADDKKVADKQDPEKTDKADAKKDDESPKKPKKEPEEKVVYGETFTGRLKRMDANNARDFTIEVNQVDPVKANAVTIWQNNEMARIMQQPPKNRPQQMAQYQRDLARKQSTEIYSLKDMDLRAADNCKIRSMFPPTEFDDKGKLKVFTSKELAARKGNSKLPGYPADFDRLNVGQTVNAYLAKTKAKADAKKKSADDDVKPEVVMIVVTKEAPAPR